MRIQKASMEAGKKVQTVVPQTNIPKTIQCPKCGGTNRFFNINCSYCGYEFKEKDYFDAYSGVDTKGKTQNRSGGRLWGGLLLAAGGIASFLYGVLLHQNLDAPWASLFRMDAGTAWIFLGAIATTAGLLLLISSLFRKK